MSFDLDDLTDDEDFLQVVAISLMETKVFRVRENHFLRWTDEEFVERFRINKRTVVSILDLIKPTISNISDRNHAVSPELMLLTTLRFYATGSFLNVCGDFSGLHKSSVSRIVNKVSRAIASLRKHYIYMPRNEDEKNQTQTKIFEISSFPKCIGALDSTHIKLVSLGGEHSESFRNRKGFFSLNVQTVCDADLKIRNIVVRWPGSTHNAKIFLNSNLKTKFELGQMGDSVLVGGSSYPLKTFLLTPLTNPTSRAEQQYNESLFQTRNLIARSHEVWKRRFPILANGLRVKLQTVEAIVVSTAILHNIACEIGEVVPDVNDEIMLQIQEQNFKDNVSGGEISTAREPFINYFENLLKASEIINKIEML